MQNIPQILSSLGLLESEIKVYLAALENGPNTVLELSNATKLSRQACYTAIQSLTERGIMSSMLLGKKRHYTAEDPDKLVAYGERQERRLKETLSELKKQVPKLKLQAGGEKPVVKVYEGKEGMHAIIEDLGKRNPEYINEIGDVDAVYKILTLEDLKPYREMIARKKVKIKSIYSGTPFTSKQKSGHRYWLPDDKGDFRTNISVDQNKITIVTFEGKMYSLIIESKAIAKTLHILFDLAFQSEELRRE